MLTADATNARSADDELTEEYKQQVSMRVALEAENIRRRADYQKYDPKEIDTILMKVDPYTYNYTSDDLWNLGLYRIKELMIRTGTAIFYHYDHKKKTKSILKPALLSTYFQIKYPIVTIKPETYNQKDTGDMWYYDESTGMYQPNAEIKFSEEIKQMWRDEFETKLLFQTFENIRYSTYISREEFTLEPEYIPVQNGILWVHDLDGEIVIDHVANTSELYVTSRIPHPYDPTAKSPRFENFLMEILPGQLDERNWLQEYIGYSLYRSWPHDKVIMLHGEGDNGKSTLLDIIRHLLGEYNCTTIGLYDLCNGRWYVAEIYLKLANIDADTASKDLENTSKFKTATGGDRIMGERKGKHPFFFESYCKHFMSCNKMPYCYDDTDAFYRRWFLIKFFEQFTEKDPRRDPFIRDKLYKEMPGILNWALEGLKRLLKNGGFTNPPTTEDIKAQWNILSNPLYAFIYSPYVVLDANGYYPVQNFYEDFLEFAKRNKLVTWTKDKISKRMNHHFDFIHQIRPYNPDEPDHRPYCWQGIRMATDEERQQYLEEFK